MAKTLVRHYTGDFTLVSSVHWSKRQRLVQYKWTMRPVHRVFRAMTASTSGYGGRVVSDTAWITVTNSCRGSRVGGKHWARSWQNRTNLFTASLRSIVSSRLPDTRKRLRRAAVFKDCKGT